MEREGEREEERVRQMSCYTKKREEERREKRRKREERVLRDMKSSPTGSLLQYPGLSEGSNIVTKLSLASPAMQRAAGGGLPNTLHSFL